MIVGYIVGVCRRGTGRAFGGKRGVYLCSSSSIHDLRRLGLSLAASVQVRAMPTVRTYLSLRVARIHALFVYARLLSQSRGSMP
jgi:hypothetical protein